MTILRNAAVLGAATMLSRILGFVRDGLVAAVLGSGPIADAFVVALRLPNLFRRLFAEGAFAAAFVPAYVAERDRRGAEAARFFAGRALVALVAVTLALTVVVWIWAETLVSILAPGWSADPQRHAIAAALTRLTFPYLIGIGVVALLGGQLAAERRFAAAGLAPIGLNLLMIAALVALIVLGVPSGLLAGRVLSATVAVAGFAQMSFLAVAAARAGVLPRLTRPAVAAGASPALRRLGRAMLPGLVAGGMVEVNIVVGTMIASAAPGAVAWLYYADRLYQLPLGIVGIAIGQVLLPEIAEAVVKTSTSAVREVQNRALELALALALPAAVGLALLATPIVSVLFQRGAFSPEDTVQTARALAVFALGLPAFVAIRVFTAAHWGRGDTATPMVHGLVAVALNVGLALTLRPTHGWIAVAWATSAAAWVNLALLAGSLMRRGDWVFDAVALRRLPRLVLAAAVMGAVVEGLRRVGADALLAAPGAPAHVAGLALLVGGGLLAYGVAVPLLGAVDLAVLRGAGRRGADASCEDPSDRA